MIYIVEYPLDGGPVAWCASSKELCRQSIIATHDLEPHTSLSAALDANQDGLEDMKLYPSTKDATMALDDPRTWQDMDAYHALESLVFKTLEIN